MSSGDCWNPSSTFTVSPEMGFGDAFICQTSEEKYMVTHLRTSEESDVLDEQISSIQKFVSNTVLSYCIWVFDYNLSGRVYKVATEYNDLHLGTFMSELKSTMVKTFLFQIISGVQQYHLEDLVHLDIRPQNILVYGEDKIKVANYKLAFASGAIKGNKEVNGCYRAPEILYSYPNSHRKPAGDMWSVGCIFAEMLMGKPLFTGPSIIDRVHSIHSLLGNPEDALIPDGEVYKFVTSISVETSKKDLSKEFPDLEACGVDLLSYVHGSEQKGVLTVERDENRVRSRIMNLLRLNPEERLEAGEALEHPYFAGI